MCTHCIGSALAAGVSRRDVLASLAAGVALAGMNSMVMAAEGGAEAGPRGVEAPVIRVCYLRPKAKYWLGWPGTAWDPEGFVTKSKEQLEGFAKDLKVKVVFEPEPLYDDAAVDQFIASVKAQKPQGVIVFPLHMEMWGRVDRVSQSGFPTIIFAGLGTCFTGHIATISKRPGVYLASTGDYSLSSVRFGMKMIKAYNDIHRTKVVVVAGNQAREQVLNPFGLTLKYVPRKTFPDTLKTIGETPEVLAVAEEYQKTAQKIVEPTKQDIINASKNYFTALQIMKENDCQGITMDCLGLVASREIPTPPCMAWAKLLDVGVLGVCEADINAVMSSLLCSKLLDKPGFIQDPVPDTVNNTFIGAHCVCPTKLNGFDKPAEPFILRSHSESNIGVSFQVLFKVGQEVTVMQMMGPGRMILGHGKVLRNLDTPPCGGCRTSVELSLDAPADTRETKGFHQLFIYGDHRRDFAAYGQMFGIGTESI